MTSNYILLQFLPDKGSLRIYYFILKHDCCFQPLGYLMDGKAVLDLSSALFIKSELHCRRFAPLWNSEFYFIKSQLTECYFLRI